MSGYDSDLFIKYREIARKISDIAQTREKYSFLKNIYVGKISDNYREKSVFLKLRFLDSFRFIVESLEKQTSLDSTKCFEIRKRFTENNKF